MRRLLFASSHCVLDPSSDAATATRDLLHLLAESGLDCWAVCSGLLGVDYDRIRREDWEAVQDAGGEAITQSIGRLAREAGFEGLLAPSARHERGTNMIYFPDRLPFARVSSIRLVNPQDLPPPGSTSRTCVDDTIDIR